MSFTQKEAVFNAVSSVLAKAGREIDGKVNLSTEERASVTMIVAAGIAAGTVVFSDEARAKHDTEAKIKAYTAGMVGNWLTKDTRLNGGGRYVAKNPGSRAGQGDEQLRNLKNLRSTLTEASHIAAVDEEISKRSSELAASKAKKVEVDFSKIPADLLSKLNIAQ